MSLSHNRDIAAFIHLSSLSKYLIPFGNFIFPLILWTINKDKSEFINSHGKQVINFQLSLLVYAVGLILLTTTLLFFILLNTLNIPEFWQFNDLELLISKNQGITMAFITLLAVLLIGGVIIIELVLIATAVNKANKGETYKYPLTIKFLK